MTTNRVEFVSYDGAYPNLCSGTLILRVEGVSVEMPKRCLRSGGRVWFDDEWNEHVEDGVWKLDDYLMPEFLKPFMEEMEGVINANIPCGCCGGCV